MTERVAVTQMCVIHAESIKRLKSINQMKCTDQVDESLATPEKMILQYISYNFDATNPILITNIFFNYNGYNKFFVRLGSLKILNVNCNKISQCITHRSYNATKITLFFYRNFFKIMI